MGWARYENQWSHAGSLPGTSAHMEMREDGLSFAALANIRSDADDFDFSDGVQWWIEAVSEWPDRDLWPIFLNK